MNTLSIRPAAPPAPRDVAGVRPPAEAPTRDGVDAAGRADQPAPPLSPAVVTGAAPSRDLQAAREQANRKLAESGSELTFEFDDDAGRMIAKLVDRQTREVIRQVPSEELLAIARALSDGKPAGALVLASA